MFGFIKKDFIGLLSFSGLLVSMANASDASDRTKCM